MVKVSREKLVNLLVKAHAYVAEDVENGNAGPDVRRYVRDVEAALLAEGLEKVQK